MQDSCSPLLRPRSVPMGSMQPKDCIIAVNDAAQLAQQLMLHAGKVSCVITAFGTCQLLEKELGETMYDGSNRDKVSFAVPTLALVFGCLFFCAQHIWRRRPC
jgi:hypothetical protein